MKDINYVRTMAQNCIEELNAIGIYPNITADKITINTRLRRVWGRCWTHWDNNSRTKWHFTIEVSSRLLGDDVPDNSLRSNLLHEMCHACDECVNVHHGGKWAEYAELINDCYGLNVQRCTSSAEYHVADDRKKYVCECKHCGEKMWRMGYRAPKWYSLTEKHMAHGYYHKCTDGTHGQLINPHIEY